MNRRLEITAGRLIALIIGIPVCLIIIGLVAVSEVAEAGQGSYPVGLSIPVQGRSVTIGLDSGSLHVAPATDDYLRLRGIARYALVRSAVSWRVTSGGVTVESHCHFPSMICQFDYHAAIPAAVREDLSVGKGDITAAGLTNLIVSAASGSGDITLTFIRVPERVSIQDAFGNVTVVLPPGRTAYKVSVQAALGMTSVTGPTSPTSAHVITVVDSSGNIWIKR